MVGGAVKWTIYKEVGGKRGGMSDLRNGLGKNEVGWFDLLLSIVGDGYMG